MVEVPVYIERIIEKPVDRIVEKIVEVVVEVPTPAHMADGAHYQVVLCDLA